MAEPTLPEIALASGLSFAIVWVSRTWKEGLTRSKWRRIMRPLATTLGTRVQVNKTRLNTNDPDLRIDGRFEGYKVVAECWQDDGKAAHRRLRVQLFDPELPDRSLLARLTDAEVGKDLRWVGDTIEFWRHPGQKGHQWTDWKRVLKDMVAAADQIRRHEQGRR